MAFASVARRAQKSASAVWLTGWLLVAVHFAANAFLGAPGNWAGLADFIGLAALACAGVLFMWAAVSYRQQQPSSRWMLIVLLTAYTLYLALLVIDPVASWALTPVAALNGALPLAISLSTIRQFTHPLRWTLVGLNLALAIFLLIFQHRPDVGPLLAVDAVLFIVYFSCAVHFWYTYRRGDSRSLHYRRRLLCVGGLLHCGTVHCLFFSQPPI